MKKEYVNDLAIRFYGLRRSGNHAVINWIAAQQSEPVHFRNNCPAEDHPFMSGCTIGVRKGTEIEHIFVPRHKFKRDPNPEESIARYLRVPKKCLIYSYENYDIRRIPHSKIHSDRDIVGRSRRKYDIVILRELHNWLASKLIVRGRHDLTEERFARSRFNTSYFKEYAGWEEDGKDIGGRDYCRMGEHIGMWKAYAREILGETQFCENLIPVLFDRWFCDREYRRNLATKLEIEFTDRGKNVVAAVGGSGSSFDNLKYDGNAEAMKVLERWNTFKHNRLYQLILEHNPEAVELSRSLFGEPGKTRDLE